MSYRDRRKYRIDELPRDLHEALELFEKDDVVKAALGEHLTERFLEAKREEVQQYNLQVSRWEIDSVSVEGHQPLTPEQRAAGKKPWVYVGAPALLENLIFGRLEDSDWVGKIDNAVREQLLADQEDAAEACADMRRDERMGL